MRSLRNARAPLAVITLSTLLAACGGGGSPSAAAPSSQGEVQTPVNPEAAAGTLVLVDAGTSQVSTGSHSLTSGVSRLNRAFYTTLGVLEISGVEAQAFETSIAFMQGNTTKYLITWTRKSPDRRLYGCTGAGWQPGELAQLAFEFSDSRIANLPLCDTSVALDADKHEARYTGMTLATQATGGEKVRTSVNFAWQAPGDAGPITASGSTGSGSGTTATSSASAVPPSNLQLKGPDLLNGTVNTVRLFGDPYSTSGPFMAGNVLLQAAQISTDFFRRVAVAVNPLQPDQYLVLVRMGNTLVGSNQRVERDYVCRSAAWSETEFQQTNMAGTPYSVPCSGAATFTRQGNGWSVVMNQLVVPEASGQTPSLTLSMNTAWVEEGRELAEYNNVMGMFLEANLPLPDQVVISESSSASGLTPLANGQYQLAPNSQGFSLPETITGITGESMIWRRIDLMNEAPLDVGLIQKEFQTDRFVLYARSASATPMGSKLLACRSSTTSNQEALRMLVDAVTSIGGVSSKVIDICPLGVSFDQQTQRLRAANVLLTHNGVVDGTWVATLSARVGINVNIGPNR